MQQSSFEEARDALISAMQRSAVILEKYFIEDTDDLYLNYPLDSNLKIIRLESRLGRDDQTSWIENLTEDSVTRLLFQQIKKSIKHLQLLNSRISDRVSKVLVTGDLNAGKSTFCNVLIRRDILPTDQQPYTEVFTEIMDSSKSIDSETDQCFGVKVASEEELPIPMNELKSAVLSPSEWKLLRVYVHPQSVNTNTKNGSKTTEESDCGDSQESPQSLEPEDQNKSVQESQNSTAETSTILHNGSVDVVLVDAPGLNTSTVHTTSVFARQEEIDVIVLVINAENHITLSAQEFLKVITAEKSHIFIIVNKFDLIRDGGRCKKNIESQVEQYAPETAKLGSKLVHFISSQNPNTTEFKKMESCLEDFILTNRTQSKLLPAKNYLSNIFNDLNILCINSMEHCETSLKDIKAQLEETRPQVELVMKEKQQLMHDSYELIERVSSQISLHTRRSLMEAFDTVEYAHKVKYPGILKCMNYAEELKHYYLNAINTQIQSCEEYAVQATSKTIKEIQRLGLSKAQDFALPKFKPESMFVKQSPLTRLDYNISFLDFIDLKASESFGAYSFTFSAGLMLATKYVPSMHQLLQYVLQTSRQYGFRSVAVPLIGLGAVALSGFMIHDIQNAVPRKLAAKTRHVLNESDFIQHQSNRISRQFRKVSRYPQEVLRSFMQSKIGHIEKHCDTLNSRIHLYSNSMAKLSSLRQSISEEEAFLQNIDLD